jgi:hypothetical protein
MTEASEGTELEALKKRVAELEKAAKPAEPFVPMPMQRPDYTAGASMPASALAAMMAAVPESVMRGIVADAFKPNPVTGGPNPQPTSQVQRGSGWIDERPLEPPPGIEHCDRLVDAQDRIDRAELALRLAKAGLSKGEG